MIWLLVSSGRGPVECQVSVNEISKIILKEALTLNIEAELIDSEESPYGLFSALIALRSEDAETFAKSWTGTIKWICQSSIRKEHKRKNWFISVSLLSPPSIAMTIKESDLKYEAMCASGPGGQNVNKVASKIRLLHIPTGIVVTAQEERSQYRNKALALARLNEALSNQSKQNIATAEKDRWQAHNELERGNEIRIYKGPTFERIK